MSHECEKSLKHSKKFELISKQRSLVNFKLKDNLTVEEYEQKSYKSVFIKDY